MTDVPEPRAHDATRKVSRGAAIAGGFGAAAAVARALGGGAGRAHAAAHPFAPGFAEVVYGRLRRVIDDATVEITTSSGVQTVAFEAGSLFWREGEASLADFAPGEEVLVEGMSSSGAFVGYALINIYRGVEAHILGRSGSRLTTDHGAVRLIAATRFQHDGHVTPLPAARTAVGADVDVLGRLDPAAGDLVALRVYETPQPAGS